MANFVYVGISMDGFMADKDNNLDWLESVPNPEHIDLGYKDFTKKIDAIVMGQHTYKKVLSFDIPWPYEKPVFVCSYDLDIPKELEKKVFIVNGDVKNILKDLSNKGYQNLYIDGGNTIQSFLKEDLIDEITLSIIPILLGGGIRLFGDLLKRQQYELVENKVLLKQIVSVTYKRKNLI